MELPPPLPLDSDEPAAQAYCARLARACAPILTRPTGIRSSEPIRQAHFWLDYVGRVEYDAATREDARRFGEIIADEGAARQALALWRSVEAWHEAYRTRAPPYALRHLMSDLSEDACCANWHFDTEYALWELVQGERDAWMRLSADDPQIAELRRLHEGTDGWWRHNDLLDGGLGAREFVATEDWRKIYAANVDDPDRATFAIVDGKLLRGKQAVDTAARLLNPKK